MTERVTKTIITPGGNTVVLKTYLSGRESDQIQELVFRDIKVSVPTEDERRSGVKPEVKEVSGASAFAQIKKTLEMLLVSVNGVTEQPIEVLLDLPATEYEFVKTEVNNITSGGFQPAK